MLAHMKGVAQGHCSPLPSNGTFAKLWRWTASLGNANGTEMKKVSRRWACLGDAGLLGEKEGRMAGEPREGGRDGRYGHVSSRLHLNHVTCKPTKLLALGPEKPTLPSPSHFPVSNARKPEICITLYKLNSSSLWMFLTYKRITQKSGKAPAAFAPCLPSWTHFCLCGLLASLAQGKPQKWWLWWWWLTRRGLFFLTKGNICWSS